MKRPPIVATLIVALAVAAMIGLGVWQLDRARWKEAMLQRYAANSRMPATAFPLVPVDDSLLFRRSGAFCLQPVGHRIEAGRSRDGRQGWRHLISCRRGAEGPGILIDIGWSADFKTKAVWTGGRVTGVTGPQPDHRSLLETALFQQSRPGMLLVADKPAAGLQPSALPSLAEIPNNHRAYAVQWFLFAGIAALIYGLALRRRNRRV